MDINACINTLKTMRVNACKQERVALDQAIDSIQKLEKVKEFVSRKTKIKESGYNPYQE